ncbi:unnamed protein product, partial [Rhizoctonia solani]
MRNQVHHSVPFLSGQDDITRSDDEGDSTISSQQVAPAPSQGTPGPPTPVDSSLSPNVTPPDNPTPQIQLSVAVSGSMTQITPAPICPEPPVLENPPCTATSSPATPPSILPPSDRLAPCELEPDSSTVAPGNTALAPELPLPVPIITRNLNSHPRRNLEQNQNKRRRLLALSESALLYGPSRRHVHSYASNLYARTKPQIYTPNLKASNGPDNAKKYQGSFSIAEQLMMYPAEHSMLYDLICVDPFPVDDATVTRGFLFAQSVLSTRLGGEDPSQASHALRRFMMGKLSRKRNSMFALVQSGIISKYGLPADPVFDDLDVYHQPAAGSRAKFTHPAIIFVLKTLFFQTKPSVGI